MENNNEQPKINEKKKFSFKEYMNTHPESKKRHCEYVATKIECDCGRTVSRGNMSKHKLTTIHLKGIKPEPLPNNVDKKKNDKMNQLLAEIENLKKLIINKKEE